MEGFIKISAIAAGGALGAVARHLINISPLASSFPNFPLPTLVINVSGSFLAGFLLILLTDRFDVGETVRLTILVGFLGAFTTFATFEMELYGLSSERRHFTSLLYLVLSVAAGFVAVAGGVRVARLFV